MPPAGQRPLAHEYLTDDPAPGVQPLDPRDPPKRGDFAYLGEMLLAFEASLPEPRLTVVVTTQHDKIPRSGRDVVVVERAGPDASLPPYAPDVLALFKTHHPRPVAALRPGREPPALTAVSLLSYLQVAAAGARNRRRFRAGARVETLPLGVIHARPVTVRPVLERPVDVLFNGSISTKERTGWRGVVSTPKIRSRAAMVDELRRLQAEVPQTVVELALTSSFAESKHAGPEAYWERLAAAKICLAPRGDTLETYRVFEAARAGCVVIAEKLPPSWFMDGAPVIDQTGWRDLRACVRSLLEDPDRLVEQQRRTIGWWEDVVSPAAAGRRMAETVRRALADEGA